MDCKKVGRMIQQLRRERGMTQKNLANALGLSDKTISKWECAQGCPDITLVRELSALLGVSPAQLLAGELHPNETDGGNMKQIRFYHCPTCGNTLTAMADCALSCCGRTLLPLKEQPVDDEHRAHIEEVDDEWFITMEHEMQKDHYLSFAAYLEYDRMVLVKLYPEQNAEIRMHRMRRGKLYLYCSRDGLFVQ